MSTRTAQRAVADDPPAAAMRRRSLWYRVRKNRDAYAFLSVPLVLFGVFTLFALGFSFYLTFHQWSIIELERPFIGLQNYRDMLDDRSFLRAVVNTFYFTGVSVPVAMLLGLAVALLLNLPLRARGVLRTLYFLPFVTPFVVVAIIWKWLYNGDYGLFNYYLLQLHLV